MSEKRKIGVLGLGYVGLPVALAFAAKFPGTVGFDVNERKVKDLKQGIDVTGETESSEISDSSIRFTADYNDLMYCNFYVVAVPTPVDGHNIPDFTPLLKASEVIGKVLKSGDIVVYESTVYPGVTEEVCAPVLERCSGLKAFTDFKLGYSPERINPGDKERSLSKIMKVVSGQDADTLKIVSATYKEIISAGVYEAASIKVAEAAKVIENTQRDLNIALINELAIIFDRMNISTQEVLDAAATKWNFLKFKPGLVGGHCIGVDPYYLTYKAEELGIHPQVITAGRRINDSMGPFIAQKIIKLMARQGISVLSAKIGLMGITFKENVSDIRNSKVPTLVHELKEFGANVLISDVLADTIEIKHEYDLDLVDESSLMQLDVLILAVPHAIYLSEFKQRIIGKLKASSIVIDVKSALDKSMLPENTTYWSL